jgi:hypothetical protein
MAQSKFMSIAVALICAAGVTVAAQSGDAKDKKKEDGAVTTAAKATAKTTADGAKATGKKSAEVAKATGGKSKEVAKATGSTTKKGAKATGSTTKKGAKKTAGGAKKLGVGIKDAVTPGSDKDKDKSKK